MGIFTRARDIMNSNINAALDKAEDPEKLVKQMIREMEDTLVQIKSACATAMASERRSERDSVRAQGAAKRWENRAELGVDRGREELAREALRTKRLCEEDAQVARNEADKFAGLVAEYKDDIIQIEEKLRTAQERQRVLVQRHVHAVQKRRAQREIRKLDTTGAIIRFDEYIERVDRVEAEGELTNYGRVKPRSLEGEFAQIERDEAIEEELQALKDKRQRAARTPALA